MQASDQLRQFGEEFLDVFEGLHEVNQQAAAHILPRRLTITMITFVCSLSRPIPRHRLFSVGQAVASGQGGVFYLSENRPLVSGSKSIMLRDKKTSATTQIFDSGQIQVRTLQKPYKNPTT